VYFVTKDLKKLSLVCELAGIGDVAGQSVPRPAHTSNECCASADRT